MEIAESWRISLESAEPDTEVKYECRVHVPFKDDAPRFKVSGSPYSRAPERVYQPRSIHLQYEWCVKDGKPEYGTAYGSLRAVRVLKSGALSDVGAQVINSWSLPEWAMILIKELKAHFRPEEFPADLLGRY